MRLTFFSLLVAGLLSTIPSPGTAQSIRLFDGESFDGWQMQNGDPVKGGWEVVDGAIHLSTGQGRSGNIITTREFGDFELRFEWRIAAGGNNGLKYRVRQYGRSWLGCEYQMLDDSQHRDALKSKTSTASLYDVYAPSADKYLKPVGEFNSARVVVCGNRLEHWLNDQLVLIAWVGSWEWYQRIADSKFHDLEGFGENRYGRIMLTDHNSEVWYRNIELTPLTGCYVPRYYTATEEPVRCRRVFLRRLLCRRR